MSKYWLVKLWGSGGVSIIIFLTLSGLSNTALAYPIGTESSDNQNFLDLNSAQDDLSNVSQVVNDAVGGVLKGLIPAVGSVNISTSIPILNPLTNIKTSYTGNLELKKFFSLTGVSTNDLVGILKGAVVLMIQIFITVVSVVSQIVKGILQALNIDIGIGGF